MCSSKEGTREIADIEAKKTLEKQCPSDFAVESDGQVSKLNMLLKDTVTIQKQTTTLRVTHCFDPSLLLFKHCAVELERNGISDTGLYHGNVISLDGFHNIIACQHPMLPKQVDESNQNITNFFEMLFQHNAEAVFNLTYQHRSASNYLPEIGKLNKYGDITVQVLESKDGIKKIKLSKNIDGATINKSINVYEIDKWPDGSDLNLNQFKALIDNISQYKNVVVHCLVGNGRTMTALAALSLQKQIKNGLLKEDKNIDKCVNNTILAMRKLRGSEVITSPAQRGMLVSMCKYWLAELD